MEYRIWLRQNMDGDILVAGYELYRPGEDQPCQRTVVAPVEHLGLPLGEAVERLCDLAIDRALEYGVAQVIPGAEEF